MATGMVMVGGNRKTAAGAVYRDLSPHLIDHSLPYLALQILLPGSNLSYAFAIEVILTYRIVTVPNTVVPVLKVCSLFAVNGSVCEYIAFMRRTVLPAFFRSATGHLHIDQYSSLKLRGSAANQRS